MKYKLINKQTGEETLCDKVTIDGFDYYVSDELPKLNDVVITAVGNIHYIKDGSKDFIEYVSKLGKKVIATNNPNIDIPKVVDELMYKWNLGLEVAEKSKTKNKSAMRNGFVKGYNKSQETHPFSEEDILEFAHFYFREEFNSTMQDCKSSEEILQLWKEQQPKIIYYE